MRPTLATRWRSVWSLLHEPRVITALMLAGYLTVLAGGTLSWAHPPGTIKSELGPYVTGLWCGLFILGGALGAVSCPAGRWWLERPALVAVGTGFTMYGATVATLQVTSPGSRWMQLATVLFALLSVVARWHRIRWAALDPTRAATR